MDYFFENLAFEWKIVSYSSGSQLFAIAWSPGGEARCGGAKRLRTVTNKTL